MNSISSDDFVDEEHHLNINRDPFPAFPFHWVFIHSRESVPRRILHGYFVVDPQFFSNYVRLSLRHVH